MNKFALPAATLVATGLLGGLAGCSTPDGQAPAGSPTAPASSSRSAEVNDADVAFAQQMIPHHEQAVQLSDLLLAKDDVDPALVTLAEAIKKAQQPEIDTMRSWLTDWGHSATPSPHRGHGSSGGGMAGEEDLQRLREADTRTAERVFLELMIAHHEGAVTMAQTELEQGSNPAALKLAQAIIDAQQVEIDTMRALLADR